MVNTNTAPEIRLSRPLDGNFSPRREFAIADPPIIGRLVLRGGDKISENELIPYVEISVPCAAEYQLNPIKHAEGHQFIVSRKRCEMAILEGLRELNNNVVDLRASYSLPSSQAS